MGRRMEFEYAVVTAVAVPGEGRTHATYDSYDEAKAHIKALNTNPKQPPANLKVATRPKSAKTKRG